MQKTLGLDFGHCEVAMSLTMEGKKPENLILDGNKEKVIPAQIALTDAQIHMLAEGKWDCQTLEKLGEIAIGNEADPKNDENMDSCTFMYFKKAPAFFQEIFENKVPRGALMAAYLYQLMKQVFDYNPDYLDPEDRGNISLVVGCPTTREWTGEEEMRQYKDLICSAVGISNVSIIPESRAAMFSSIESTQSCISAGNGAVVFDFGSSTADCTYMLAGRRCIEYSWRLGAQEIESQMANVAFEGQKPSLRSRIYVTSQLRRQKELYYNGSFGPKGQRLFYDTVDRDGQDIEAYIRVNDEQMGQVVNGEEHEIGILCDSDQFRAGTWMQLCREFFRTAKEIMDEEELPCANIVLTGGASKMAFVRNLCREIFGENVKIHVEKNPSFSVANGLGWVSAIDARVPAIAGKTETEILSNRNIAVESLVQNIAAELQKVVAEVISQTADKWAAEPGEHSVSELIEMAKAEMDTGERREQIKKIIDSQLNSWRNSFQEAVQKCVNANSGELMTDKIAEGVVLTKDVWKYISDDSLYGSVSLDDLLKGINMNGLLNKTLQVVAGYLTMCILLVALPGIGLFALLAAWLAGKLTGDFLNRRSITQLRDQAHRESMKPKIKSSVSNGKVLKELTKSVSEQFKEMEKNYSEMVGNTVRIAYEVVTLKHFQI
ncbi:MAG: hypothetical protein Q4C58_07275 [Eubacteriales bacterium]|nr:hypothetical protein [Eubacteriales bacterium]